MQYWGQHHRRHYAVAAIHAGLPCGFCRHARDHLHPKIIEGRIGGSKWQQGERKKQDNPPKVKSGPGEWHLDQEISQDRSIANGRVGPYRTPPADPSCWPLAIDPENHNP